ncbi:MAG: FHA domain-containing protein [Anaerolineae bacterium]|nr:FHA domain-containing protein [Anaerolineae bacterium]
MQSCPNCGSENMEGILFCTMCGFAMGGVSINTRRLDEMDASRAAGGDHLSDDHIVLLHIPEYPDPVALKITDQVVLGRAGGDDQTTPFFNLEPFGAGDFGVSRRHATLIRHDDQLFAADLGSTNHTLLNGHRLNEYMEYTLRDGDEISLGRFTFRIFFK